MEIEDIIDQTVAELRKRGIVARVLYTLKNGVGIVKVTLDIDEERLV
jgi:hypothetical protein